MIYLFRKTLFFFNLPFPFRTFVLMALHNYLYFVAIIMTFLFLISPKDCSVRHLYKLAAFSLPPDFSISCKGQALFPQHVYEKYQLFLSEEFRNMMKLLDKEKFGRSKISRVMQKQRVMDIRKKERER